jgi:hypothetical protein
MCLDQAACVVYIYSYGTSCERHLWDTTLWLTDKYVCMQSERRLYTSAEQSICSLFPHAWPAWQGQWVKWLFGRHHYLVIMIVHITYSDHLIASKLPSVRHMTAVLLLRVPYATVRVVCAHALSFVYTRDRIEWVGGKRVISAIISIFIILLSIPRYMLYRPHWAVWR